MAELNQSLNTSKKNLICNHCMYDCKNYENMRDHYQSDFHKYNLNRVTMNLNPLTYEDYTKKKELYQRLHESKLNASIIKPVKETGINMNCDICVKKFSSNNKFDEHMRSRAHKKNEELAKENSAVNGESSKIEKIEKREKSPLEDTKICLFCNLESSTMEANILHMIEIHKLDIPFIFCVKNMKGLLRLLAKKICTYNACLTCDCQNFKSYRAVQNHMIDTQHTTINLEDLEEFLFKFYDRKILLSIKDTNLRRLKEFRTLKFKLKTKKLPKKQIKENTTNEDGWETVSEEEDETKIINEKDVKAEIENYETEIEDYDPVVLPNGELLLENGVILGNKIYQNLYKQRIHLNRFDRLMGAEHERTLKLKNLRAKIAMRKNICKEKKIKYYNIQTSNKSSFIRINTLFKALKQVNC